MVGHGGAGVSTVAAAGAVETGASRRSRAAATRLRDEPTSLLVTLDRFRQASRLFGVYSRPGVPVPVSQHAHLLEIDTLGLVEDLWAAISDAMPTGLGEVTDAVTEVDPAELIGLPGIETVLALRAVREVVTDGRFSRIVLDCSGGVDPYAVLRAPRMYADLLERIWPRHRRLSASGEGARVTRIVAVVDALARDCEDLAELFTDPATTTSHVVTSASDYGREMARRHLAVLELLGIPAATLIVNAGASGSAGAQDSAADGPGELDQAFADMASTSTLVATPRLREVPRSVRALRGLGVSLRQTRGADTGPAAARVEHVAGHGLESRYRLAWPQSLPDPADLSLGRSGDDLLVTVCGVRRAVRLPSVLRRCTVDDARWENGVLAIGFRPDPAVWPAHGTHQSA